MNAGFEQLLTDLNFPCFQNIHGRASIADLYQKGQRCGIYVLRFENGAIYVGQAVDVTRRFIKHRKTHSDICEITFKAVDKCDLSEQERAIIWELEQRGIPLRNVTFTSLPKSDSDFDLLMPADSQEMWVTDTDFQDWSGTRADSLLQRQKYENRYAKFQKDRCADEVITFLRRYVCCGIPAPVKSELSFWCCSLLPSSRMKTFSRINIYWQEVLTICHDGELIFSFHLALTPLESAYGETLDGLFEKYPRLGCSDHFYEPGGADQFHIEAVGLNSALELLDDSDLLMAIRLFNLRLMKKGPCVFSRSHCFNLVDELLAGR